MKWIKGKNNLDEMQEQKLRFCWLWERRWQRWDFYGCGKRLQIPQKHK